MRRLLFIALAVILITSGLTFSGCAGGKALTDPLKIDTGYISGAVIGEVGNEVHTYLGIPYAAPPVGNLRWQPPQPAASWSGTRECTAFSDISPQFQQGGSPYPDLHPSEDCLYLNVLTPAKKTSDKLPVMVWLHGGSYTSSSGNEPHMNSYQLPQHGVVLVTVNMRLGTLGLMAHPLLSQESPNGVSGNYMFLDIIASLEWVQRNIAAFGGDPSNVTIFGGSGGACKVSNLMASPLAKGLFQRAICQSGSTVGFPSLASSMPLADLEARGEQFFATLGVSTLAEARAVPWETLVEADMQTQALYPPSMVGLWEAAVDGWFLTDTPTNIFQAGKQNAVPLIVCTNLGELSGAGLLPPLPFLITNYVEMLSAENKAGVEAYACIFDQVPARWRELGFTSGHGMELAYVVGDVESATDVLWSLLLPLFCGAPPFTDPGLSMVDQRVSDEMMTMWAQFAKTGNPSVEGLITWPAWEASTNQYLYIGDPLEVKSGFSQVAQP